MNEQTKKLNRGEEYKVELFPQDKIVTGMYLGISGMNHIFSAELDGKEAYLFVDNHWLQVKDGIVSHISVSSAPIYKVTREWLDSSSADADNKSRLVEMLREVGVKV